jgi:hypothetical protein
MHPALRIFGIAITSMVIAACWFWAYVAVRESSLVTVVAALGLSLTLVLSIRMMLTSPVVTPRVKFTDKGTLLQPDVRIDRDLRRLIVTGTLSTGLCFFAWWPFGALYLPLFREDGGHIVPVIAGGAFVPLAWMWWKQRALGSLSLLLLTPDGFKFPTVTSMHEGNWDDIAKIEARLPSGEQFWNPMVLTMKDGSTLLFEAPGTYTPRGTALVEMVRFYWKHPASRDELTDGRALQRLARLQEAAPAE